MSKDVKHFQKDHLEGRNHEGKFCLGALFITLAPLLVTSSYIFEDANCYLYANSTLHWYAFPTVEKKLTRSPAKECII